MSTGLKACYLLPFIYDVQDKIHSFEFSNYTLRITVIVFTTGFKIHKVFHVSRIYNSKDTGNCKPLGLSIKEEKYI